MENKYVSVYQSSAPPFPLGVVASRHVKSMKQTIGLNSSYSVIHTVYHKKNGEMLFLKKEIHDVGKKVLEKLLNNPGVYSECQAKYLLYINKALKLLDNKNLEKKLSRLSDKGIADLFKQAVSLLAQASAYPEQPNFSLELYGQQEIKQRVFDFLKSKGKKVSRTDFDQYFNLLLFTPKLSFTQQAELMLLEASLLNKKRQSIAVQKYVNKFFWRYYDYYGPIVDREAAKKEFAEYKNLSKKVVRRRIKQIRDTLKKDKVQQKKALSQYDLPHDLKRAIVLLRNFGYLYSEKKKEMTSRVNYGLGQIIKFTAHKNNIDELSLHYATPEELISFLRHGTINRQLLSRRMEKCIFVCDKQSEYYKILEGEKAENLLKKLRVKENIGSVGVLVQGNSACGGKYTGRVKVIVNASQVHRIQKGDILVTTMTTVNFVPAMKKSGAIITDLGGITCHAAIVSRELGIPCVIATKIATKTLQDGDLVEVNANHGKVTILERRG
ncbi:MAG: PEP-utilizing enzyme [Patescibacteria group bacterium]|jgi:phosphohistidine swiveling domain-containing protein